MPEPEDEDLSPEDWPDEHLSDLGNARRMVRYFGEDLRFAPEIGWLVWDGGRWSRDPGDTTVMRMAARTIDRMYEELVDMEGSARKTFAKHVLRSEGISRGQAMVKWAQSDERIVIHAADLDKDPWLFNCQNGTIDLRTGELRPHERTDLISRMAPVDFDPDATCPLWEMVLDRSLASKAVLIDFFRRAVGYSLTAETSAQVMFILWGTGQNGKSTIMGALQKMCGEYAQSARAETLMSKDRNDGGESANAGIARMAGARLIRVTESDQNKKLAVSLVKDLTGGEDKITARFQYKAEFDFYPTAKIWLAANHKPVIEDTTNSIWRRLMLVPFTVTIPDAEKDTNLPTLLACEYPGILAWAVRGCLEWQRNGLQAPREVLAAVAEYRTNMDVVQAFINDMCVVEKNAMVKQKTLYDTYASWADSNGEKPLPARRFSDQMKEHGYTNAEYGAGGYSHWFGIGLKSE